MLLIYSSLWGSHVDLMAKFKSCYLYSSSFIAIYECLQWQFHAALKINNLFYILVIVLMAPVFKLGNIKIRLKKVF